MAQLSKVLKVVCWAGSGLVPNMLLASEDIKQKQNEWQRPFSPSVCRGRLFVYCCGRCSCVHLRGEPVSSYFSMACCSVVSY